MGSPREGSGAVVVTGASSGIGLACALHLDRLGFEVFAGVRQAAAGDALRAEASERLQPLTIDVTDREAIAAAADRVSEATGNRVVGLVNNAGIAIGGPLEALPIAELRRIIEVNVVGQVAVTQAFLPQLRRARGRIVLMSSIGGRMALPFLWPYHASKFALEAIGDSLRQELRASGVGVSIIEPGSIDTGIWDKGLRAADSIRDQYSEEIERVYGASLERLRELARESGERGIPPERVANAVAHALGSARPRTRYLVGLDARVQAALARFVPDRLRDRVAARLTRF